MTEYIINLFHLIEAITLIKNNLHDKIKNKIVNFIRYFQCKIMKNHYSIVSVIRYLRWEHGVLNIR